MGEKDWTWIHGLTYYFSPVNFDWYFNIAIEIVDLPIKNGGSFHSSVNVYRMVKKINFKLPGWCPILTMARDEESEIPSVDDWVWTTAKKMGMTIR